MPRKSKADLTPPPHHPPQATHVFKWRFVFSHGRMVHMKPSRILEIPRTECILETPGEVEITSAFT